MRTFHPPPGWPPPPPGWQPPPGWEPDPRWPPAPPGWVFWTDTSLHGDQVPASSGVQRSWFVRFGWLVTLVAGVLAYLLVLFVMVATQNLLMFPSLLLIGSVTVPVSVLLLVYATGRQLTEHLGLISATAIAGAIIGTTTAALLEYGILLSLPWLGMIAVGFIEEAAKLIVPFVIFLFVGQRTPGLGLVLGVASGAGFAALETMGYGLVAFVSSQGNVAAVGTTLLLRAILSPAGHVAWTAIACAALWQVGEQPSAKHPWAVFLGAYLLAVALHTAWDGTTNLGVRIFVAAISVAGLLTLIVLQASRPAVSGTAGQAALRRG